MHAVIIGNGIGGVSAAIRMREKDPNCRITMISGESDYHYSRPALMYIYMGHQRYEDTKPYENHFWREQRIDLVRDWVVGIDTNAKKLTLHRGSPVDYDVLLLATGSQSNKFGWPGQDLAGVQGLWDLMDLKALYENSKRAKSAVIVGGGLIGIELGEMLHSRGMHVTFLVRETSYWKNVLPPEESEMVNQAIRAEGFDLRLGEELDSILDDGKGCARAIKTKNGEEIPCEIVGLTAGVHPNIDLAKAAGIPCGRGILTDWTLRTHVDGVFAAGDCAELENPGDERNTIQQVWYSGKRQGRVAGENMLGARVKYDPGLWYNSAKFLHLEYQTYGFVLPKDAIERSFWWRDPKRPRGVRIVYDASGVVTGLNVMGTRLRHEVCEKWLVEKATLQRVVDEFPQANFDPEFYPAIQPALRAELQRSGLQKNGQPA